MSDAKTEIERLIFLCDQYNDVGEFDKVGELFAHGAIGIVGMGEVVCEGAKGVADQFRSVTRVYPEGGPRTHHLSTNLIVDIDETAGTATCWSNYVMFQQAEEMQLQPINAGRNFDRFERVDGKWRWKHRMIHVTLNGEMSHHLVQQATPFA